MLMGPTSTKKEIAAFAAKLAARPHNYIAQPTLLALRLYRSLAAGALHRGMWTSRPFVLDVSRRDRHYAGRPYAGCAARKARWW